MVIGVFRGVDHGNNGEEGVSWEDSKEIAVLRYDPERFQVHASDQEEPDAYRGTPFGMYVVPKTTKAIILEENVQQYIGFEPKWQERHRFAAMP